MNDLISQTKNQIQSPWGATWRRGVLGREGGKGGNRSALGVGWNCPELTVKKEDRS